MNTDAIYHDGAESGAGFFEPLSGPSAAAWWSTAAGRRTG